MAAFIVLFIQTGSLIGGMVAASFVG